MRCLFILIVVTCLRAADLSIVTLPNGARWSGYYEKAADVVVSLKPRAVIAVPEGALIESMQPPANETTQQIKDRVAALNTLAEHMEREAPRQRMAQQTLLFRDAAADCRKQAGALAQTVAAADLMTSEPASPVDPILGEMQRTMAEVKIKTDELITAQQGVAKARKAAEFKIANYFMTCDLSAVNAVISTTDKRTEEFNRIRSLNNWMTRVDNERKRLESSKQKAQREPQDHPLAYIVIADHANLQEYSRQKKVEWLRLYLDAMGIGDSR